MSIRKWTRRDAARAQRQGWDVFDYDGTGLLEICKLDESDRFKTDGEALRFVIEQASRGSITAKIALRDHVRDAWKLWQEFNRRMNA